MRINRRAIAIINRNYVMIRQQPPLRRTVFSEATSDRGLNKSATKFPSERKIANIAQNR
jgi:hypothetical protein